jgi:hypothetical protein
MQPNAQMSELFVSSSQEAHDALTQGQLAHYEGLRATQSPQTQQTTSSWYLTRLYRVR